MAALKDTFALLSSLTCQESYQLLRVCISQDMPHLLRQLDPSGIVDLWEEVDECFTDTLDSLRNSGSARDLDIALYSLPISFGGLGVPSHVISLPHATSACVESSEFFLVHPRNNLPIPERPKDIESQLSTVRKMQRASRHLLLISLNQCQQAMFTDNCNKIANSVLLAIPTLPSLTLKDSEFHVALSIRSLHSGRSQPTCTFFQLPLVQGMMKPVNVLIFAPSDTSK